MKILFYTLTLALCGLTTAPAEGPEGKPEGTKGPRGGDMRMKMKERFLENLSPENRRRFEAAREKALQDPRIQELRKSAESANREFFGAMRKKMMEIDPGLEEIVKKNALVGDKGRERWEGRRDGGGFGDLSEPERQQLMAAREKAKADPSVRAAEKLKEQAATPEDRKAASEEFRKVMHAALLKADPTLGPILEKMVPKSPPPAPPAADAGDKMMDQ
jgi:hypothetical protein